MFLISQLKRFVENFQCVVDYFSATRNFTSKTRMIRYLRGHKFEKKVASKKDAIINIHFFHFFIIGLDYKNVSYQLCNSIFAE